MKHVHGFFSISRWLVLLAASSIILSFLHACSGGSNALPQSSIPAPTLTVEGSVTSPSSGSSNLSPALKKIHPLAAISDLPASGIVCHLYSLEGEELADFTTGTSGTFSANVLLSALKGSEDADSSSWSEPVVLECENGIQLYTELSITEGTTTSVSLGTASSITTLSAINFAQTITGWSGWGQNIKSNIPTIETGCFLDVQDAVWNNTDLTTGGLRDEAATLRLAIQGYMASGGSPASLGYSTWPALMKAAMDGSLDSTLWQTLVTQAATVDDTIDADQFLAQYSTAATALNTIRSTFATHFTSGGIGTTDLALTFRQQTDSNETICQSIEDGDLDPSTIVGPVMAADDIDGFESTFTEEGVRVLFRLASTCLEEESCETIINKPDAYFGFFNGFDGDYSRVYTQAMGFDSNEINGIFYGAQSCEGETQARLRQCAEGMERTIGAGGGFQNFERADGSIDQDRLRIMGGIWIQHAEDGIDPSQVNASTFSTLYELFHNTFGAEGGDPVVKACIDTLVAQSNFDFHSCFPDDFQFIEESGGSFTIPSVVVQGSYNLTQASQSCPTDVRANPTFSENTSGTSTYYSAFNENLRFRLSEDPRNAVLPCAAVMLNQTCSLCNLDVINNGGSGTSLMLDCSSGTVSCHLHYAKP